MAVNLPTSLGGRARRVASLLLCGALLAQPLAARAEPKASTESKKSEARTRYDRGLKLYDQGAYEAALVEMRRAYELAPAYKILYNLGLIHEQLNDHAAALDAFQQYLREGGKKIDAKRRAEVDKHVETLQSLVATVTIEVDLEGAEITIDDAVVGTSPLAAPIVVNAGKRRIAAKVPGKPAASRVIAVAGNDAVTVKLELAETPAKAAPVTTSGAATGAPAGAGPDATSRPIPWLAWGVTGVFAASAITTGVLAMSSSYALADKRDLPNARRDDLDAASSRTRTLALVTDVLIVGTIAAASVSLYLTLKAPPANDRAATTVRVGVAPTGFTIVGSF